MSLRQAKFLDFIYLYRSMLYNKAANTNTVCVSPSLQIESNHYAREVYNREMEIRPGKMKAVSCPGKRLAGGM